MIVKYRRFAEKYKHASIRKHSTADAQLRDDHVDWVRPCLRTLEPSRLRPLPLIDRHSCHKKPIQTLVDGGVT